MFFKMGKGLQNYPGISTPNSTYPNGNIVDKATPINKLVYADIHQTFAKLLRSSGILGLTPNGLPENEYNGFQYIEAMLNYFHNRKLQIDYPGTPNGFNIYSIYSNIGTKRMYFIRNGGAGNRIVYVPPSSACTNLIFHRWENRTPSSSITVTPQGGDTIDWSTSPVVLNYGEGMDLVCIKADGNWLRVG
jgi:hypothetical protein